VKTASDTQKGGGGGGSDSSIRSISGADARDDSKSESILEDISQGIVAAIFPFTFFSFFNRFPVFNFVWWVL
jgi:hypothetical protein